MSVVSVIAVVSVPVLSVLVGSVTGELIVAVGVIALLTVAATRLVALDGYGQRAAPRSVEEWSANGLPSRPYGV